MRGDSHAGFCESRGVRFPPATHLGPLPVTERLSSLSLILPLFHEMTEDEQDRVVSVIRSAAGMNTAVQVV